MSQHNYSLSSSSNAGSAQENLLTPAEVATLFRVDPKTVTRWAKAGNVRFEPYGVSIPFIDFKNKY